MLHLNDDELREVTGYAQRDKQAQALAQMGVPFKMRPKDRQILVLRDVYYSLMSGGLVKDKKRREPNWSAA